MPPAPEKQKKEPRLEQLRALGGRIAIVALVLSGWVFLFMSGQQTTTPQPPPPGTAPGPGAQAPLTPGKEPKPEGTFVMSYTLVLLSIALGIMFVTNASKRRDRFRPPQYKAIGEISEEPEE